MAFTFKHGDRPLDGYTIQRGVGRGGFGEVYYAVSDGGKDVALKYLRDNPEIELRGVEQCINIKSPHLVSIFDVRKSQAGEYFIIMEYISGPSLRDLLAAEPNGLGAQKAAFFLREIGKGLAYLHDRGIVHRDLKPGNIFYDDGLVKIGDYGLSKFMSVSRHSAQTASVGTVHYMAPEVGGGQYTRSIDIYALGVILYEMLLGKVPFEGSSMGEVLMKHLTQQPEVDNLPQPFAHVIRKALAKHPNDRYQTVHEMMQDVFDVQEVQKSLAGFNPELSLSGAARQVFAHGVEYPRPSSNPPPKAANESVAYAAGAAVARAAGQGASPPHAVPPVDRRDRRQRMVLSGFMAIGMSVLSALFAAMITGGRPEELAVSAGLIPFAGSGGLLLARRILGWLGPTAHPLWAKRLVILISAGVPMLLGAVPALSAIREETGGSILLSVLIVTILANWGRSMSYGSAGALSVPDVMRKAFGGFAVAVPLSGIMGGEAPQSMFIVAGIVVAMTLIIQAAGWWLSPLTGANPLNVSASSPLPPPMPGWAQQRVLGGKAIRFGVWRRSAGRRGMAEQIRSYAEQWRPPASSQAYAPSPGMSPAAAGAPTMVAASHDVDAAGQAPGNESDFDPMFRSGMARAFWSIVAFGLFITAVAMVVVLSAIGGRISHTQTPIIVLVTSVVWSLFALSKTTARRRAGFWRESFRPFLLAGAASMIGVSITLIASPPRTSHYVSYTEGISPNARAVSHLVQTREAAVGRAMIPILVLSSVGFLTVLAAAGRRRPARSFVIGDSSRAAAPAVAPSPGAPKPPTA